MKSFKISRSRNGTPCVTVGGGAYTNTYVGAAVFHHGELAKALFIKSTGPLSCTTNQAVVPISVGDAYVEYTGRLPINPENPESEYSAWTITRIGETEAFGERCEIEWAAVHPESVVTGLSTYHNRNGAYFCMDVSVLINHDGD